MTVSAIIPNYNGKSLLEKNFPQILEKLQGVEAVVVDDGSADGSVEYLKKHFPQVKCIEKITRSGFATSVNLGVKAATGDIIILLNTDSVPKPEFLRHVLPHFKDRSVFAIGLLEESIEGKQVIERGRGIGWFDRGMFIHARGEVNASNTLWASGGSSVFSKKIWEELGGMDELYNPFYWEDIDLSYRALKRGYKVLFEAKSVVEHRHSEGSIRRHFTQHEIQTIAYRNQLIFTWKNITDAAYLWQHFLWLPINFFRAFVSGDTAFIKGFVMACIRLPLILKRRLREKNLFKRSDKEVLSELTHD